MVPSDYDAVLALWQATPGVLVGPCRGQGIAKAMVDSCVERLQAEQLGWVHLDVAIDNAHGLAYWQKTGWRPRDELIRLSRPL